MSEEMMLQYRTETDIDHALLKKALRGSILQSGRRIYYAVMAVIYVFLLALLWWLGVQTGDYSGVVKGLLIFVIVIALAWFSFATQIKTSLRRWKEQTHEDVVRMFGGFNQEGFVFGHEEKHSTLHYADMHKVYAVSGVWVLRTKAGLLVFYNAAQLPETDRESVMALLKSNNPKIKIQLPKK